MTPRAALLLALGLAAGAAHAQTYRCVIGGRVHLSDRPCATGNASPMGYYGPAQNPRYERRPAPLPSAAKAPDHLKYLGAECASISEAIRTGPSRGVRGDVIGALHEEYREKCSAEDSDARRQLGDERRQQMQERVAQREAAQSQRQEAEARSAQCLGMRDVLTLKRKRAGELNATELAALRDLERSFNERCIVR